MIYFWPDEWEHCKEGVVEYFPPMHAMAMEKFFIPTEICNQVGDQLVCFCLFVCLFVDYFLFVCLLISFCLFVCVFSFSLIFHISARSLWSYSSSLCLIGKEKEKRKHQNINSFNNNNSQILKAMKSLLFHMLYVLETGYKIMPD